MHLNLPEIRLKHETKQSIWFTFLTHWRITHLLLCARLPTFPVDAFWWDRRAALGEMDDLELEMHTRGWRRVHMDGTIFGLCTHILIDRWGFYLYLHFMWMLLCPHVTVRITVLFILDFTSGTETKQNLHQREHEVTNSPYFFSRDCVSCVILVG